MNLIDPFGLYPVCRLVDTTYTTKEGNVVVESKVGCYDNGQEITPIDALVIGYIGQLPQRPETQLFTLLSSLVLPVNPNRKIICPVPGGQPGQFTESYHTTVSAFLGGIPGHQHGQGQDPGPGPEDGATARQGGRNQAYIGMTTGVVRVDRHSAADYSVSLLSGSWGVSDQFLINMVAAWNRNDGMVSATSNSQRAQQSGTQCTITNF